MDLEKKRGNIGNKKIHKKHVQAQSLFYSTSVNQPMNHILAPYMHEELTKEEALQFFATSGYLDTINKKIVLYYDNEETWKRAIHIMIDERIFNSLNKIVASSTTDGKYLLEAHLNS